jgi:surfactin family lipopeptide synthetase A
VTCFILPPSLLSTLDADGLPNLRIAIVAGEACPAEVAQRWSAGRKCFNFYGPTECSIWSTYAECFPDTTQPPIGRPIPGVTALVLDREMQPVPIAIPGELYIGGLGVGRGYLRRDELTTSRFVSDPANPSERLYRTGDVVRWLPDGSLDYLGRADHQVKLRGFRIELQEIETNLLQHPAVENAAVVLSGQEQADRYLLAFVSCRNEHQVSGPELREYLSARLPRFMVPARFTVLDRMPMTLNGKLDRSSLPHSDVVAQSAEFVPLDTDAERSVAQIWSEILNVKTIGVHDNFFDLGGHSLLLTRVHNELRSRMNADISIADLFRYPTVRALAEYLNNGTNQQSVEKARDRGEIRRESTKRQRELRSAAN